MSRRRRSFDRTRKRSCRGARLNNVLLYGDAGTGKSTSVKAILNEYADRGLRKTQIELTSTSLGFYRR